MYCVPLSIRHTDVPQDARPRPDLTVSLAGEGQGCQIDADGHQEVGIRHVRARPASGRMQRHLLGRFSLLLRLAHRARQFQHPADPLQPVRLAGPKEGLAAHRDDLRPTKGRRAFLFLREDLDFHHEFANAPPGLIELFFYRIVFPLLQVGLDAKERPLLVYRHSHDFALAPSLTFDLFDMV